MADFAISKFNPAYTEAARCRAGSVECALGLYGFTGGRLYVTTRLHTALSVTVFLCDGSVIRYSETLIPRAHAHQHLPSPSPSWSLGAELGAELRSVIACEEDAAPVLSLLGGLTSPKR